MDLGFVEDGFREEMRNGSPVKNQELFSRDG